MSLIDLIPEDYREGARSAAAALSEFDQVLVAAHVNLDGDALGSLGACGAMLKCLDREFALYSSTGVPENLRFLALPGKIYKDLNDLPFSPQCAVYVDCSDRARLGDALAPICQDWPTINIDHHLASFELGSIYNYIRPEAAAASQLMAYVALGLGLPLEGELGECIALGLMTDTGGFCHGNTTADVFALCALLSRNGCPISRLREDLLNNWSIGKVHMWGELLLKARREFGGRIAICAVTKRQLKEFHCGWEDLEGLVEWYRKIKGTLVAALVKEETAHSCKFSLRSYGDIDVRSIAAAFGGGGHKNAAGGNIALPVEAAQMALTREITEYLSKHA